MNHSRLAVLAALSLVAAGPSSAAKASLSDLWQSVLPVVTVGEDGEYDLHGNAVLMDKDGHLVTPAHVLTNLTAAALLPVPRLGVLTPGADDAGRPEDPAGARVFTPVRVLALDPTLDLALLELGGDGGRAVPVSVGAELELGDERHLLGFGAPGITPYLYRAGVAGKVAAPSVSETAYRYSLDSAPTAAVAGGVLADRASGRIHALAVFHLRNVHRVVARQADFEHSPAGLAVGIPIAEVQAWASAALADLAAPAAGGATRGEER